ncbi:MAG: prohibitin family protein [Nitrospirae bacterium]|nr:prohibitin family protein [Nitrospirota bacterium]MBF0534324.1 prohibitin family protein [Nitrospirota bacterium]MBF0615695.1 prohibitin family protein [Nitrospirota bacterium]
MPGGIFDGFEPKIQKPVFKKSYLFVLLIIIGFFVLLAINPFVTIGAGERGVVLNFGAVQPLVLSEGIHVVIPVVQKVIKMDVKVHKAQTNAEASSRDLQEVTTVIAINYHILPDKANMIYQSIGMSYKERVIDPAIQEVVKAVAATYTAEELITKRPIVSAAMKDGLMERLHKHFIIVDEVSIVNFAFSKLFMEAIESKQTAEQLALKAARDLDRIKIEAEQKITQAKAEAEALRLQKENISPDLIKLRRIEATMKAIDKWNGIMPKVTTQTMPFIDATNTE